ncbi:hypothetical protein N9N28_13095 [Rubripirellula amarantea]|nr:hypothetical protein [Rubripirellula amarantea]
MNRFFTFSKFGLALVACLAIPRVALSVDSLDSSGIQPVNIDRNLIPADNVAFISASQEVRVQLELLASLGRDLLSAKTIVTIVRPSGESEVIQLGDQSQVTIQNVQPGPHAIVASGGGVFGAMLYYFHNQNVDDLQSEAKEALDFPASKMTLLRVRDEDLRGSIDRIRGLSTSNTIKNLEVSVGQSHDHSFTLGDNGLLSGQLVSVDDSASLSGTQVQLFQDGVFVSSTQTLEDGTFKFVGLRQGVYGLVASGNAGYSAFSFDAVGSGSIASKQNFVSETFVNQMQSGASLPVVVVPPPFTAPVVSSSQDEYVEPLPFDGVIVEGPLPGEVMVGDPLVGSGSFGGSSSGGFGGGGGGFGGRGLGAGALFPLLVLPFLFDDDDNAVNVPVIVSRSTP